MIYFVRHGLSEANVKRVFAGQKDDSLLTEEGREQAKKTGKKIVEEEINIDRIISSPSKRALETAEIIAKELKFNLSKIIKDDRINEFDMGSLSGTPWREDFPLLLASAKNAEDPQTFRDRVYACVKELSELSGNTLVVSHAGVGRILETIKQGKDAKSFYGLPPYPNASVTKIDWIK
ncbi:MAG: histidine phosphatase family protein [Candidatus Paceibacterota bacterium]|jgi:probable phosphoglycerate mutase